METGKPPTRTSKKQDCTRTVARRSPRHLRRIARRRFAYTRAEGPVTVNKLDGLIPTTGHPHHRNAAIPVLPASRTLTLHLQQRQRLNQKHQDREHANEHMVDDSACNGYCPFNRVTILSIPALMPNLGTQNYVQARICGILLSKHIPIRSYRSES